MPLWHCCLGNSYWHMSSVQICTVDVFQWLFFAFRALVVAMFCASVCACMSWGCFVLVVVSCACVCVVKFCAWESCCCLLRMRVCCEVLCLRSLLLSFAHACVCCEVLCSCDVVMYCARACGGVVVMCARVVVSFCARVYSRSGVSGHSVSPNPAAASAR